MKIIRLLKNITLLEIVLNTILAFLFIVGIFANLFELSLNMLIGAGILHVTSMILHWLAWNQLPITHRARIIFNLWVMRSFAITFLCYCLFKPFVMVMMFFLLIFAAMWFIYYCVILFKEYSYLKRRKELYDQRELVHF